jgi:hypothetical protein
MIKMILVIGNEAFNDVVLHFNLKNGGYGNYKTIFKE